MALNRSEFHLSQGSYAQTGYLLASIAALGAAALLLVRAAISLRSDFGGQLRPKPSRSIPPVSPTSCQGEARRHCGAGQGQGHV